MPDSRSSATHRGAHPKDAELFGPRRTAALREATSDLSWLLSRGYSSPSALKLCGDRYALTERQRRAVARAACAESTRALREAKRRALDAHPLDELWIDGFNVLLTLEVALGGGVVLACRDGCLRDIASVHGTYRRVYETVPAVRLLTEELHRLQVSRVRLLLDAPVSNSGRLSEIIRHEWEGSVGRPRDWQVLLVRDPDAELVEGGRLVATADGAVLDRCDAWVNLAREVVSRRASSAFLVDLGAP